MNLKKAGKIIILTAPSGAGKTSITRYLLGKYPDKLAFSISAATRRPRGNEKNGIDYYFISQEEFTWKIQHDAFVEWEMVYEGKYYGTLIAELERIWESGRIPLLDIDVKGAIHVEEQFAENCLTIFIEPPSIDELQKRLLTRGTESMESMQARVSKAGYELSFKHSFDTVILNDDFNKACKQAEEAVLAFLE
jgi:guanylate kinase